MSNNNVTLLTDKQWLNQHGDWYGYRLYEMQDGRRVAELLFPRADGKQSSEFWFADDHDVEQIRSWQEQNLKNPVDRFFSIRVDKNGFDTYPEDIRADNKGFLHPSHKRQRVSPQLEKMVKEGLLTLEHLEMIHQDRSNIVRPIFDTAKTKYWKVVDTLFGQITETNLPELSTDRKFEEIVQGALIQGALTEQRSSDKPTTSFLGKVKSFLGKVKKDRSKQSDQIGSSDSKQSDQIEREN